MTEPVDEVVPEPIAETRAFWERLGIPGLFDVHVHFLPPSIQRAVWAVFDAAGPKIGRPWPIRYRQSHEDRVEILRLLGVRRFSTLPYAHKPGVATWLNEWSRDFAAGIPEAIRSATFFPEPEAATYVADEVAGGVEIFKSTCRWASSTSTTRCSTAPGRCCPSHVRRSSCTLGRGRWRTTSLVRPRWSDC